MFDILLASFFVCSIECGFSEKVHQSFCAMSRTRVGFFVAFLIDFAVQYSLKKYRQNKKTQRIKKPLTVAVKV